MIYDFLGLFLVFAGFIVGLGAVTVIDLHGFLGRKSKYWTEATTRTHKVTKPLIWLGFVLLFAGGFLLYRNIGFGKLQQLQALIYSILLLNGCFLSFYVSPILLTKEKEGKASELLSQNLQNKILISFLISFSAWWSLVLSVVYYLLSL